ALASNEIGGAVGASVEGAAVVAAGSSVRLSASAAGEIETLAVGGAGAGGFALGGSVSLNHLTTAVEARVTGGAAVNAACAGRRGLRLGRVGVPEPPDHSRRGPPRRRRVR